MQPPATCISCGSELPSSAKFCPDCGATLPQAPSADRPMTALEAVGKAVADANAAKAEEIIARKEAGLEPTTRADNIRSLGCLGIVALSILGLVYACSHGSTGSNAGSSGSSIEPSVSAIDAMKAALRTEPQVKDFIYQEGEAVEWQVGVLDDGTPRIGYAMYICELLSEHGARKPDSRVRVVDIVKVKQGINFRNADLGTVKCADGSVF